MSESAIVVFVGLAGDPDSKDIISPAVFLNWYGVGESVYGLLDEMGRRNIRPDPFLSAARLCQVAGELLDLGEKGCGVLSVCVVNGPSRITPSAIGKLPYDPDHGVYVVVRNRGGGYIVRRFVRFGKKHREMTAAEIEQGRELAYAGGYLAKLAARFVAAYPDISKNS